MKLQRYSIRFDDHETADLEPNDCGTVVIHADIAPLLAALEAAEGAMNGVREEHDQLRYAQLRDEGNPPDECWCERCEEFRAALAQIKAVRQ